MSEIRQRKKKSKSAVQPVVAVEEDDGKKSEPFARHAQEDTALQQPDTAATSGGKGLTSFGRFALFIVVPFSVGSFGIFTGYLRSINDPDKKLDLDSDFIFPTLLTLLMIVVVGFQTDNFQKGKAKPLVMWPKVYRKKKIIHKTVIVDDEEEDDDDKQHQD